MDNRSITHAVETFSRFVKVQKSNPKTDRLDAIDNFALGAGLDDSNWDHLCTLLNDYIHSPDGELGWAIVGFMMGLYAAEHEEEL